MYKVLPDTASAVTWAAAVPVIVGLKEVFRAPVLALKAARKVRATSPVPSGSPGGRTEVNWPPAYTTPPEEASAHTVLLVCHAASGVELTPASELPAVTSGASLADVLVAVFAT